MIEDQDSSHCLIGIPAIAPRSPRRPKIPGSSPDSFACNKAFKTEPWLFSEFSKDCSSTSFCRATCSCEETLSSSFESNCKAWQEAVQEKRCNKQNSTNTSTWLWSRTCSFSRPSLARERFFSKAVSMFCSSLSFSTILCIVDLICSWALSKAFCPASCCR